MFAVQRGVWKGLTTTLRLGWPVSGYEAMRPSYRTLTGAHRTNSPVAVKHSSGVRNCRCPVSHFADLSHKRFFGDQKTTALMLLKDLKHLTSSPGPALALGLGGLIPFVSMPTYMIISGAFLPGLAFCHVAYGACILSFIGGVRWGTAVSESEVVQPNWFNLGYSVTPSLIAWMALLLPTGLSLVMLMTGLAGAAYMDITMYGYPPWFKALRFVLSMFAILSLWTSLMCMLMMPERTDQGTERTDQGSIKLGKQKVVVETSAAKSESGAHDSYSSVEEKAKAVVVKAKDQANIMSSSSKEIKDTVENKELKE